MAWLWRVPDWEGWRCAGDCWSRWWWKFPDTTQTPDCRARWSVTITRECITRDQSGNQHSALISCFVSAVPPQSPSSICNHRIDECLSFLFWILTDNLIPNSSSNTNTIITQRLHTADRGRSVFILHAAAAAGCMKYLWLVYPLICVSLSSIFIVCILRSQSLATARHCPEIRRYAAVTPQLSDWTYKHTRIVPICQSVTLAWYQTQSPSELVRMAAIGRCPFIHLQCPDRIKWFVASPAPGPLMHLAFI